MPAQPWRCHQLEVLRLVCVAAHFVLEDAHETFVTSAVQRRSRTPCKLTCLPKPLALSASNIFGEGVKRKNTLMHLLMHLLTDLYLAHDMPPVGMYHDHKA